MKVIIAGTRHFTDYNLLREYCDMILANQTDIEIVSGGAKVPMLWANNMLMKKAF